MRNQFLKDWNMLPIVKSNHLMMKESIILWGLRLASIQCDKPLKEERQTNSLRLRLVSIHLKKALKEERETNSLRIKTCFHSMEYTN